MAGWAIRYSSILVGMALAAILLQSCAQQVAPTGGDKDEVPPKILASNPKNNSVAFLREEIMFEFDEYVSLKGANQELIVSPPLKYPVDFKLKNKKLYVSWKDTLRDNTTYLFQFGDGIVDVNEGNPLDSNLFVFSTGPFIDSFSLEGKVIDAFDLKPVKDVWVMLYSEDVDSLPYKELPRYFAKTNEKGEFHLQYLSQGEYKIFALESVNGGYLYDVQEEAIGFLSGMLPATSSDDTIDSNYVLRLFVQDDSTQYVKSFAQEGNKGLIFEFNRAVEKISVSDLDNSLDVSGWSEQWSEDLDSVAYWFAEPIEYDSLKLKIDVDGFEDTIFFRKPVAIRNMGKKGSGKSKSKSASGLSLNASVKGKQPHFKNWNLTSKTPLKSIDGIRDGLFIEGKDTGQIGDLIQMEYYSLVAKYNWKQGLRYTIVIPDSSIYNRFGETNNDSLVFSFTASQKEDFGQLLIKHQLPDNGHPFIWQLLNDQQKIIDEIIVQPNGEIAYPYLETGKYSIRILYDLNSNGIWDTGYYLGKRQPEAVKYYDQPIEIRSNWASELEWKLLK